MTPDELKHIGCLLITWNNVVEEYYLPLRGNGLGVDNSRIGVRFGEHPDWPFRVYLFMPSSYMVLKHIDSITRFTQLYTLLTGKKTRGG